MLGLIPALEGLVHSSAQVDQAANNVVRATLAPADQVDLSAAAIALLESRNNFEANSKVAQVSEQMEQSLLNIVG